MTAAACKNVTMSQQPHYIKEWRKERGLSQEQLAERIGIERSYVTKIENGSRRYDQPFLEAAAVVLNVTPADLVMRPPSDPEGLWSIYDQLTPDQRQTLVEMGRVLQRTGTK